MDVIQFQEKLRNICELGKQNGNMLTHEQIREHFASTDLETSQMLKVLQYLKLQGIMIEGDTAPVETEEVGETEPESKGTSTPLTSEEEAYLKDYLAEVSNGKEVSPEMLHTLFENLADGDAIAEAALTSIYLPVAANMAADMNCTEIQLADLIQAFQERKELSVNDISELLSCNRQSVYNYIDRLGERGFELERKTQNRSVYFTLISDGTSTSLVPYIPLTDKILRKCSVVQNLQTAPATP